MTRLFISRSAKIRVFLVTAVALALGVGIGLPRVANAAPEISISGVEQNEGTGASPTAFVFNVTLSEPVATPVTASWATEDITAKGGASNTGSNDYLSGTGTVTFAANAQAATISIPVTADSFAEPNETFKVKLSNPSSGAVLTTSEAVGTITNDDAAAPVVRVTDPAPAAEGAQGSTSTQNITIDLVSGTAPQPITVNYATSNDTASSGSDYVFASGTATILTGFSSTTVPVTIIGDNLDEGASEKYIFTISNPSNASLGTATANAVINDDDDKPVVSVANNNITEGDSGSSTVPVTFQLSGASAQQITVDYATSNDTALAGSDYVAKSGTVTFAPGATTAQVSFAVIGDNIDEANEKFRVNISNPVPADAATIAATPFGEVTINDNDSAPVATVNDLSITEGNTGVTAANFTISLSGASGRDVTLRARTANPVPCTPTPPATTCTTPTATAGTDYQSRDDVVTIPAGTTTVTYTVNVLGDVIDEINEQFRVILSQTIGGTAASDGVNANDTATAIIVDDDAGPVVELVGDPTVVEGNSGQAQMNFTFRLTGASAFNVDVEYATSNGSATSGQTSTTGDYAARTGTVANGQRLRFGPNPGGGPVDEVVQVAINGDTLAEPDETFFMNITNVVNGTAGRNRSTGLILNDDGTPPAIKMEKLTDATEGGGSASFRFSVVGTLPPNTTVSADYATQNGTAVAPGDYPATTGTVTFTSGALPAPNTQQPAAQTVNVAAVNDTVDEPDETFDMTIVNAHNADAQGSPATATIIDNDAAPALSIADKTVAEGNANANQDVVVTLAGASGNTVTVDYATGAAADTAKAPGDYASATGTLTFAPGETTKNIQIGIVGDTLDEDDETFTVTLSNPSNATVADGTGIVTITDDDATPVLSVNSATAPEGDNVTFTVSLSAASGKDVTVKASTADGTATQPGDYTAVNAATVTIPAGSTTATQNVATANDTTDEADETFTLSLGQPTNATVAPGSGGVGTGTITDNDEAPVVSIVPAAGNVAEGAKATGGVVLSNASANTVTVSVSSADGTAKAPGDYTALPPTTITFAPGETQKPIELQTTQDSLDEADETFTVNLANPTNATLSTTNKTSTGTIVDDDPSPTISISNASAEEGGNETFTLTLSSASGQDVVATISTANGTATAPDDYTALVNSQQTIPAGQTTKTFTVATVNDTTDEANETFTATISSANATISSTNATGTATIVDNDVTPGAPDLSVNDASASEGDNVTFTATLSAAAASDVTFKVSTSNGTATAGDYTALTDQTVTIPAGQTTKTFDVQTTEDTTDEPNETFTVTLSDASGANITDGNGTGTITNDDGPASAASGKITTGPGPGGGPHIKTFNPNGTAVSGGFMDGNEAGGKRVARGDVNGDGIDEIITASGPNTPAIVSVYSASGSLIASSFAYGTNGDFFGGMFVAAGDLDGDGKSEIITGAGPGGGPHVKFWTVSGNSVTSNNGIMAYGPEFHGGVTVASGDFNGDGKDDILTGPGAGGGPHVRAFSGANASELFGLMAYTGPTGQPNWTGGINVAAGDLDGDGKAEIAVAPWPGGGPHLKLFKNDGGLLSSGIMAGNPNFTGGVSLAMGDVTGDNKAEIVVGSMTQAAVGQIYNADLTKRGDQLTFYPGFGGGVFVAVGRQ